MSKGFPRLVKMHEKWAKDGLVILTVTMDNSSENDQERADARAIVEKFLAKTKPPFRTVNLQVTDATKIPKTLNFGDGTPKGFVFDRDNHYVFKMPTVDKDGMQTAEFDYDAAEKAIAEVLKKK